MDFCDFQKKIESRKVVLVEMEPAIDMSIMTLTTGTNSYYLDTERLGWRKSGYYYYPEFSSVQQNGVSLTGQTGKAGVDQNAGSWCFNTDEGRLFVRPSSDATPANVSLIALFKLYFSNFPVTKNDTFYAPRLSDVPISINSTTEDIFFSVASVGGGNITFENSDALYDKMSQKYLWKNRSVTISVGDADMTVGSYATVFSGKMLDMRISEKTFSFSIQDRREYLHRSLPISKFLAEDYPNMDENLEGDLIPIGYGYIQGGDAFLIDSTAQKGKYKYADHPVYKVYEVYNDGGSVSASQYTLDLNNGEVTFLSTWGGDPGKITVDFVGIPSSSTEEVFKDDFTDNAITDWTEFATGGTWSWTASGGKVNGASSSSEFTYLMREDKGFFAGEIEAKMTIQVASETNSGCGIVFNWDDENNNFHVILFPNKNKIKIMEMSSGVTIERGYSDITISTATQYTLKVSVSSAGVVQAYLDGNLEVTYDTGSAWTPKLCGIFNRNFGDTDFDDFSIKLPYMITGQQIVKDLCTRYLEIKGNEIDTSSFAYAAQNAHQFLSVYVDSSGQSSKDVIGRIAVSNLCRFLIGANGQVYYSYWDQDDVAAYLVSDNLLLDHYESYDKTDDIFSKVEINYGTSPGDSKGLTESYAEEDVEYNYSRPYEKTFKTYLVYQRDAELLAYKLFQLVKSPILRAEIDTKISGMNLKIGDVIELQRRRGASKTGKLAGKYRIIGLKKEIDVLKTTLTLIKHTDSLGVDLCDQYCQSTCEASCQTTCQFSCQEQCELTCESTCQQSCKTTCQQSCQTQAEFCLLGCEEGCTNGCTDACTADCTDSCTADCTATCELDCQNACETSCQLQCELSCTELCELNCEVDMEAF